jgi:crossover junction endodeoxyribonuclease RusA
MNTITIPWPPAALSPNKRYHWAVKSKAAKAYRGAVYTICCASRLRRPDDSAHISIVFHPPDNRRRDIDNMLASLKSGLDGLADYLEIDDSRWTISMCRDDPVKNGQVFIEVSGEQGT